MEAGLREGLHIGAQAYVSLKGETVADLALGEARPGVPMRPDTLMVWMSSTKPVAAVAVAQLWERGRLELDEPVAAHVPEFAANGKERITIRHLLTHTAGIRGLLGRWEAGAWDEIIAAVCAARPEPDWPAGGKAGYHVATSWYVLGELVRRADEHNRPFERYVREMVFEPLGMRDSWVGMPPERFRAYGQRIGWMQDTSDPVPRPANPEADTEAGAAACRPGSNGRGPARELGRFYEMMLNHGAVVDGAPAPDSPAGAHPVRVLLPQTVEALTAAHRVGMFDVTFKHVMDWGLGFIVNSNRYGADTVPYGFGPHASPRAFGHSGHQSSSGFADPEHGLAVAVVCNGMPGEAKHDRRMRAVHAAVYEDLGLAPAGR